MVDAAFGGKTAINFEGYKNMVGTFYPAGKIRISAAFLKGLPEREFLSGLAEVIKSAMLGDPDLFGLLAARGLALLSAETRSDTALMLDLARRSLLVKARFVTEDPTEKGIRAHLNLGHTFAHGLESATGFTRFTHGEAVAWGLLRALDAGTALGITDPGYAARARALITSFPFPLTVSGVAAEAVIAAMEQDKKKKDGRVRFVLQRNLADTVTMPLENALTEKAVRRGLG
jgi:3-dehydroquinate synthase